MMLLKKRPHPTDLRILSKDGEVSSTTYMIKWAGKYFTLRFGPRALVSDMLARIGVAAGHPLPPVKSLLIHSGGVTMFHDTPLISLIHEIDNGDDDCGDDVYHAAAPPLKKRLLSTPSTPSHARGMKMSYAAAATRTTTTTPTIMITVTPLATLQLTRRMIAAISAFEQGRTTAEVVVNATSVALAAINGAHGEMGDAWNGKDFFDQLTSPVIDVVVKSPMAAALTKIARVLVDDVLYRILAETSQSVPSISGLKKLKHTARIIVLRERGSLSTRSIRLVEECIANIARYARSFLGEVKEEVGITSTMAQLAAQIAGVLYGSCGESLGPEAAQHMVSIVMGHNAPHFRPPHCNRSHVHSSDVETMACHTTKCDVDTMVDMFPAISVVPMEDYANGEESDIIPIDVERDDVLMASYREIMGFKHSEVDTDDLMVDVAFINESGVGFGVAREWLTLVCAELFDPAIGLFIRSEESPNVVAPNPEGSDYKGISFLSWMRFAGILIGMTIRLRTPCGFHIDEAVYRIMSDPRAWVDAESAECMHPHVTKVCRSVMAAADQAELDGLMIPPFTVGDASLLPGISGNAHEVKVTMANRELLVKLIVERYVCGTNSVGRKAALAIRNGIAFMSPTLLYTASPPPSSSSSPLDGIDVATFNYVFGGDVVVTMESMLLNTVTTIVADSASSDATIDAFWKAVAVMTNQERRELLRFWTGATSVTRDTTMQLVINPEDTSTRRFPSSHTCYMQLQIPTCSDLPSRLRIAMKSGMGSIEDALEL